MSMLSHGPFNYNRFDILNEKKAKPDFLDMDKDGNKKESMKKAIKDKDGKCDDCGKEDCGCDKKKSGKKELPDFIKKNMKKEETDMSKAPSIKNHKSPKSTPVKYDKDMKVMAPTIKKEGVIEIEFEDAAAWLIENGVCKDEAGCEVWLEHATQDTLNMLSDRLDEASSCGKYQKGGVVKPGKKTVVKEDVLEYMLENNLANNSVSAEVLFDHISDEFLEEIEAQIMDK